MSPSQFQQQLLAWFAVHGRKDLPWQQDINPYRVWLSEIMLQQTQVSSVIPYFNRFVARFPTLQSLAVADLDEVLPLWAGLGYYARARNLHKTAQLIHANGGKFPETQPELCNLPGIGRSTAGAILSIAYGKQAAILDGNVKRVMARFHGFTEWPGHPHVNSQLWVLSERYAPQQACAAYTQAIMDLGATLCTRSKPQCANCPLSLDCKALKRDLVKQIPAPKPRKELPVKHRFFLMLQNPVQQILLTKRPPVGIWGGLWSLPEFEKLQDIQDWCLTRQISVDTTQPLAMQRHTFSHYHLDYTPVLVTLINPINNVLEANSSLWYKATEINNIGLPSPIQRLLKQFNEVNYDPNG